MDAQKKYSSSQCDKRSIVACLGIVLIISHGSSVGEFDATTPPSEIQMLEEDALAQEYERLRPEQF